MYEKKQLVKSSLFLIGFWILFFSLFNAGEYRAGEFIAPLVAVVFCVLGSVYAIFSANHERSSADQKNWVNKSPFLNQSMKLLPERKSLVKFGFWTHSLYECHKPAEISWNIIEKARSQVKGDYRVLFDEILSAFAGNQEVPAFIIPTSTEREFKKQSRHIEYELQLAYKAGCEQEVGALKEKLSNLKERTFEHDNRSLIKHSLLVLACAQKIYEYGGDPLTWATFKRSALEHKPDAVFLDPLLFICAFAHDIGKINAFYSVSKSTVDHDILGAKTISSFPSYLGNTSISARDRLILDTVLSNYHSPYRVNTAINGTSPCVLDNRIHRILETLILADKLAGKLEQTAYREGVVKILSEQDWQTLITKHVGAIPTSRLSELDQQQKLELGQACIGAFIATLQETIFNETEPMASFIQFDYEAGAEFAYISTSRAIEAIESKIGVLACENQGLKEATYTELLAKEGKIIHPYNAELCKSSWAWKFNVYDRSKIIHEELSDIAWGRIEATTPLRSQEGYFWIVDPEALSFTLKRAVGPYPNYCLLSGGMGNGVASAWVRLKKDIEPKRAEKIANSKASAKSSQPDPVKVIAGDTYSRILQIKTLLGRGQKSDLASLAENGLKLKDIEDLSLDEQVLVGLSVKEGRLIVVR